MDGYQELLAGVKDAIRESVSALQAEHDGEALAGYALLTDDELSTLSCMAVSKQALALSSEPDLLFCPTDWPHEPDQPAFDAISGHLGKAAASAELRPHVERAFAALVQALAEARSEGVFSADVFLSVLSTDPSPHLEDLERASVQRLNDVTLVEQRELFLAKWTN